MRLGIAGCSLATASALGLPDDYGFGPQRHGRLKAFHHLPIERPLQELLDPEHQVLFIGRHQRDGGTFLACATGPADAMHVVLGDRG